MIDQSISTSIIKIQCWNQNISCFVVACVCVCLIHFRWWWPEAIRYSYHILLSNPLICFLTFPGKRITIENNQMVEFIALQTNLMRLGRLVSRLKYIVIIRRDVTLKAKATVKDLLPLLPLLFHLIVFSVGSILGSCDVRCDCQLNALHTHQLLQCVSIRMGCHNYMMERFLHYLVRPLHF